MFSTYTNSILWPSNHHNDYCSLLPVRSETHRFAKPSRCHCVTSRSRCCCCCCYSTTSSVKPKVSINPGFVLYGIRQSTLIQWPRTRRLMIGVGGGGSRLLGSEYGVHCCDSEVYSRNRRFRVRVSGECERSCGDDDDVEAMISFLSEELVDEDCNSVIRVEEKRKVRYGGEFSGGNVRKRREGVERPPQGFGRHDEYKRNGVRENVKLEEKNDCEHCGGGRKKKSQMESETRLGSTKLVTGGGSYRRKEEREVRPRRRKSSSCSSYYSLASSGDFESEGEDEEEDVEFRHENLRSSEKKLVEQSTKGSKSRKEVSQMDSRKKRDESSNGVRYHKKVFEEGENSNQAVTTNQRRRRKQISNRVSESTGNYEDDLEIHEIHINDAETNSQNQKIFGERKDERVHSIVNDSERENIQTSQQQLKERLEARYSSEERVSEMRRRTKYSSSQEEGINVRQNFQEAAKNQQPPVEERISTQTGARISTERYSESSEIHDTNIQNTYVSQREEQIRNQEVHAGLVIGLQSEGRQQGSHIEQHPSQTQNMQSDRTSVSVSHTSDVVRYTEIQRKSEKRLIGQENITTVQLDSKAGKTGAWRDSRLDHANSKKEGQKALGLQSSQGQLSEEPSSSQSSLTLVSGNRLQLVDLVSEEVRGSETTLIPPTSQLVSRGSGQSYGSGGAFIQESSQETSETDYPTAFEHPGAGAIVNSQSAGELMRFTTQEDALGSAQRLEQSSEKFIGEFVKKAKHEVSTSVTEERRAESNQLKRRDSRRSSGGSGAKGPSDEMWVTESAQGTPQPVTTEGNAAEGNAIFKRNGRSLWSVIADIARLRWGSRAGSPTSSAKPTGKSSPNDSVSSATWFSGREHDGSSEDNTKVERVSPQEAALPHQLEVTQTSSTSQFESSDATERKQQSGRHEGVVVSSPPSTILEGGSASYSMPSTSSNQIVGVDVDDGREFEFRLSETTSTEVPMRLPSRNLMRSPAVKNPSESSPTEVPTDQNVTVGEGRRYQARVPEIDADQKPLIFPARSLRSPAVKKPSQSLPTMVPSSISLREQVEQQQQQPLSAKSQEETGSTSTGSPLTQRKLLRNKQVVRDSFEEWEEAYRVEAERRTTDEIFMREALVEAKKAADMWEVPVGAVLVHDGKIIARGYNLVEDLRDSTAHAEMICIREGSKALRSWRLADTTLYVTLEPCPMCAGAILQARVNTLVWGAPNKLLGADGSWIRLFPGGEGNGSEVSEKPPPPVHPFHPKMTIRRGVLESECAQTMQQFFQLRRKKKDKNTETPAPTEHHHHHHPAKLLNKMHQILPFFCL
ncbi:unnamed protein product [Eruca vesicaria subsp. sativa]|uniref:tRNA(adenine(34)) deaminase n=1 Tax=Eruca vesicaria subsp. sativa TaxID=29727 RepID=A0ABC8JGL4_ERUVS|nr:unnamed protein product [Eruca vesicaria subsp. sativa]